MGISCGVVWANILRSSFCANILWSCLGVFFKKWTGYLVRTLKDKLFRVLTEVQSVLQQQHDCWSPLRAFERVKKDLNILHMLCKVILAFFKKETDNEHAAVCDGKFVKMFSDMIRKSLRDEDFVSGMIFKRLFYMFCFLFLWGCLRFFDFLLGHDFTAIYCFLSCL